MLKYVKCHAYTFFWFRSYPLLYLRRAVIEMPVTKFAKSSRSCGSKVEAGSSFGMFLNGTYL